MVLSSNNREAAYIQLLNMGDMSVTTASHKPGEALMKSRVENRVSLLTLVRAKTWAKT